MTDTGAGYPSRIMDRLLLREEEAPGSRPPRSKVALIGIGLTGGVAIGLSVLALPFLSPALRRVCLPYVPATARQVSNVMKLCAASPGSSLVDLGSGDGRIVFEAARNGLRATGYELNLWLVLYSKIKARLSGMHCNANFQRIDLWKADLSKFDNIVIFGVSEMMDDLGVKLERELSKNSRVLACRFPMKQWCPAEVIDEGIDSVWMYTKDGIPRKERFE